MKKIVSIVKSLILFFLISGAALLYASEPKVVEGLDESGNPTTTTTYVDDEGHDVEKIEINYSNGKKKTSETKVTDVYKNVLKTESLVYTKDDDGNEVTTRTVEDSEGRKEVDVEKLFQEGNSEHSNTKKDESGRETSVVRTVTKEGKITVVTTLKDSGGNVIDTHTDYSTLEAEKKAAEKKDSAGKSNSKKDNKEKSSGQTTASSDTAAKRTTINIENARNTRYEKDKASGHDVIILTGNVKISVSKDNTKNVISADTVKYDRESDMMYAEGNVSLDQTDSNSGGQTVTASSLMFNTATLEGVFDDGRVVQKNSNAINLPSGSTLIVASDIFGRSESNTVAFKNGVLTFCDDEDPHWRIKANRIWLLPGGEFAFFNALMYVGPVPVLYLPAFYYPKDELIFNPVFGFDNRKGYFMQSTAYLYGRKPLDTSSSSSSDSDSAEKLKALFNFVKPSTLKEQKREGLMLHNLDNDYTGSTSNYVKILGDYYSNMGFMIGVDSVIKPKKYISNLEVGAQLGFSNTVFKKSADYLPFSPSGTKIMDKSNLLGFEMPFRYSGKFKMSMSSPFTLNLYLPVYSDPFFHNDFTYERSETMDWISYLINQSSNDDSSTTTNEISSFSWTMSGSYSVPLPKFIKPVVNSMSLSLDSSVAFSTMTVTDNDAWNALYSDNDIKENDKADWKNYTPQRKFYYPSQVVPVTVSGSISGTIIDYSSSKNRTAKASKPVEFVSPLIVPKELLSDSELETLEEKNAAEQNNTDAADKPADTQVAESKTSGDEEVPLLKDSSFPVLKSSSESVTQIPGLAFSMKYSVKPNFTTQMAYSSTNLKSPEDFQWDNIRSSMYTFKLPVNLDNTLSYGGSFFSINNSYAFNPVWQKHPVINTDSEKGGYSEDQAVSLKKADYAAEKKDLTNTNSVSLKPFYYVPAIKDTGITWRSTIKMIRTKFLDTEYDKEKDNPKWEYQWMDWSDEECITTNALDFTFATNQMDNKFSQSLTFSTTLSPQAESYYETLRLGFPLTRLAFETGVKKSSTKSDAEWVKQPFKQSASVSGKVLNSTMSFSESYNYNLEDMNHDSFRLSFSWMNLSLSYQMSYTYGFDMSRDNNGDPSGWVQNKEKEFLPYSFSLSYNPGTKTVYTWKNRISMGVGLSTNVNADLLRPTNSTFNFSPSVSFKIDKFLTFSFSSTSTNSVIYRYFGNEYGIPGEENMLKDLMNSFRFDDDELRKSSGFKLKSMNFSLTHELHDWNFNTTFKIAPKLENKEYKFDPYIKINIVWRPMSAMKTEIIDDYGTWKLQ